METQTINDQIEILEKEIAVLEMIQDAPANGEEFDRTFHLIEEMDQETAVLFFKKSAEALYQVAQSLLARKSRILKNIQ